MPLGMRGGPAGSPAPRLRENDKKHPDTDQVSMSRIHDAVAAMQMNTSVFANAMWTPVLTEAGLKNIKEHRYKAGVYTPLDNIMNPIWLRLTNMLPMWLAPNLVTLAGFMPMAISYVLVSRYQPDFSTPVPSWLAGYTGLALLFYQTFDAMDGKQARRTGSSSPLGQLFDHGCDCLACLSHHSVASMVLLPGASRSGFFGLSALQSGFFMAQWQEHYTGVLPTSCGPIGVTETQYGLVAIAFSAAIMGPERVAQIMRGAKYAVPWSSEPLYFGIICTQAWVVFVGLLAVACAFSTIKAARESGKLRKCLLDMGPVIALNALFLVWNVDMYGMAPRLVCFMTGLLFFYYTAQMIVFSMAQTHFPAWQNTLVPFACLGLYTHFGIKDNVSSGFECFTVTMGTWVILWLMNVMNQLKIYLDIEIFRIKPLKNA